MDFPIIIIWVSREISSDFKFSYKSPDGMPHSVASHLGLYCLPMSHKKDTCRLKCAVIFIQKKKYAGFLFYFLLKLKIVAS